MKDRTEGKRTEDLDKIPDRTALAGAVALLG